MIYGVILAAGIGSRFGGPKHDALIAGVSAVHRALVPAVTVCDRVVLVCNQPVSAPTVLQVPGGDTRSGSVRAGLEATDADGEDVIVIHDAARPLATPDLWRSVIDPVKGGAIAAVPVVPLADSIRRATGQPAQRSDYVAVQTPQAFRADVLRRIHASEPECSDDAGLVTLGVEYVPGESWNIKITHRGDELVAAALLRSVP